jgi:signal transduction histidine kinase
MNITRFWRDLPLGSKLVALTSLLVLSAVITLATFSIQQERASYHQELEDQARLLLDSVAAAMRDHLYQLQVNELSSITDVIVRDAPDITLLVFYDPKGIPLVDAETGVLFTQAVDPLGKTLVSAPDDAVVYNWQTDQMVAGRRISLGRQPIGAISMSFSTAPLNQNIDAITRQTMTAALLIIALGVLLSFLLGRQITIPLRDLITAAEKMSAGDLQARVMLHAQDEIGKLGQAFNQMAGSIQKRETDMRDLAAGLDMMVKSRTAELEERNTTLITANEQLTIARKQAEESTQLKSQFLASMSHELRTPLNAIMGYSQLMALGAAGALNEKQTDHIERILNSSQDLLGLISDLLDLSKIEAGRMELVTKPFHPATWITDIKKQFEGLASEKSLSFNLTVDSALPDTLIGDPDRIKQIAVNLISNAIKFTDQGGVSVSLSHQKTLWEIEVMDTGIGIASHAQEFIFDEFRQVDGGPRRRHGGTGLGLAIVRNLVLLMGGTVRVKSEVGKGSTFTVQLPVTLPELSESVADHGN